MAAATTLDLAPSGVLVEVVSTDGGAALVRRLAELGLRRGEAVRPLHRTAGGGRLVAVGDTRVALAREVLRAVEVVAVAAAPTAHEVVP